MAPHRTREIGNLLQLAKPLFLLYLLEVGFLSCWKIWDHGTMLLFPISVLQTRGAKNHDLLSDHEGDQSTLQKVHKRAAFEEDHVDHKELLEGHKMDLDVQSDQQPLEKVLSVRGKPCG